MKNHNIDDDKEGYWRPLYDGIRKSHGHGYDTLYGLIYWFIFNPQADKTKIEYKRDSLAEIAILTAVSRANIPYWHEKTFKCVTNKLSPEEQEELDPSLIKAIKDCQKEYYNTITKMALEIYPKLTALPEYQEDIQSK